MVNLKKVGAIAASALMIGATFGTAAAATFSSSMLASSGEAKAQLVVGANAPGKTADTASAQVVVDTTKSELAVAGAGGDIGVKYYIDNLDSLTTTGETTTGADWFLTGQYTPATTGYTTGNAGDWSFTATGGEDNKPVANSSDDFWGINNSLRYDENGDGDVSDANDYVLYDAMYITDYVGTLDVQFARIMGDLTAGQTLKINGDDYLITKHTDNSKELDIAPAIKKTLAPVTAVSLVDAQTVSGDIKLQVVDSNSNVTKGTLYMIDSTSTDTYAFATLDAANGLNAKTLPYDITTDLHTASDVLDAYKIFVTAMGTGGSTLSIALSESSQISTLTDGQTDVLGYNKIKIEDSLWATNADLSDTSGLIALLGDPISVAKDSDVDIPDTLFNLKYQLGGQVDLRFVKSTTTASGAKMKSTSSKYDPFLDPGQDIYMTAEGDTISVKYYIEDLDGNGNYTDDWFLTTFVGTADTVYDQATEWTATLGTNTSSAMTTGDIIYGINNSLKYDANGDGDVIDSGDYIVYNAMYVQDYVSSLDVQFARILGEPAAGDTLKINGDNYLFTKSSTTGERDIAPCIKKTLPLVATVSVADAQTVSGDIKLQLVGDGSKNVAYNATLYMIDSTSTDTYALTFVNTSSPTDLTTAIHTDSDVLDAYKIWETSPNASTTTLALALAETSQITTLVDGQTDVLGYNKIVIQSSTFATNAAGTPSNIIALLGDPISVAKDSDVDIPDTLFNLKYTLGSNANLRFAKSTTTASGAKMKSTSSKYSMFLSSDVYATVTGGADKVPVLEIVDEDTADQTMNLVLVGGPVANTLVADLVTAGKSATDWYASEGDVEVISGAFTTGKYGIIVAGKDRDATKAAAEDLAGQIA